MKYKNNSNRRQTLVFKRFGRKGYSLFNCLGREVLIGTLSVATLTYAKADGVSVEPLRKDSISTKTDRENGNSTGQESHPGGSSTKY